MFARTAPQQTDTRNHRWTTPAEARTRREGGYYYKYTVGNVVESNKLATHGQRGGDCVTPGHLYNGRPSINQSHAKGWCCGWAVRERRGCVVVVG